ncbi:glycosyltransferase [Urbifossiella limnaea]|uniref:Undecaprenyl-phosphate 4-deoxy-4-formamido-L-arabinose transferase n=1 Tax=Urbifossiella limnaea TaxID=2528023 RepID=A0A517XRL6_9BACT|nr:glycosyltransferase [Urbifossiella limnaea]QDU20156.1 Undecaprenyl-phosphate 4-deoxy-4-formamido-L-arabinose transferase [Urbifossiella limnaea]
MTRAAPRSDVFVSVVAALRSYARFLPAFVDESYKTLDAHYTNFELVLVDNGSRDDTPAVVRELLARYKCVRYLRLSRRQAPETAVMAGLDAAIGDYVVTLHPEFDPPAVIPELVEACRGGADVVVGVAPYPAAPGVSYRVLRWLFQRIAGPTFGANVVRVNSGFRCLTRAAVNALTRVRVRKRHFGLLAAEIGLTTTTHPYRFLARGGKQPRVNLRRSARRAVSLTLGHSVAPLRVVSLLGLGGSALSVLYSLYVIGVYLTKPDVMPGWTGISLQTSGLFFLVFVMLTMIGEHLGRLVDDSGGRPLYHVREEQASAVMLSDLTRRNVMSHSE